MPASGYPTEFAERCFKQIRGFGEYGFPESHAASLRPAGLRLGLAQVLLPGGVLPRPCSTASRWASTPRPSSSRDAQRARRRGPAGGREPQRLGLHAGSRRRKRRHAGCSLRLGFRLIRGLAAAARRRRSSAARRDGPFRSFAEFVRRTGLRAGALKRLAEADAFGSLGLDRHRPCGSRCRSAAPLTVFDRRRPPRGRRPTCRRWRRWKRCWPTTGPPG